MTAVLRNESGRLLRGSLTLSGLLGLLAAFFLLMFPTVEDEAQLIEEVYPAYILELLGIEALATIEGFVASYIFPFVWVLVAGIYFAYLGAGLIVRDVSDRRMDLLLATPVSRESVVLQKVGALWVPVVVLNVGVPIVVYVGALAIDESFDPIALAMVHLLSVPYLLVCAGIGLVVSVFVDHVRTARATALSLTFGLWLVDIVSVLDPDYEWVGDLTPSRYYDPTAILVHEEYAYGDAGILLAAFLVLVGLAVLIFTRRDL